MKTFAITEDLRKDLTALVSNGVFPHVTHGQVCLVMQTLMTSPEIADGNSDITADSRKAPGE